LLFLRPQDGFLRQDTILKSKPSVFALFPGQMSSLTRDLPEIQYTVTEWTEGEQSLYTQKDESAYLGFSGLMKPAVLIMKFKT
jgi:hypothetical protein